MSKSKDMLKTDRRKKVAKTSLMDVFVFKDLCSAKNINEMASTR